MAFFGVTHGSRSARIPEGRREMEGAWSDFLALRRLYGLLEQNSSGADGENGEKLDKRSVTVLQKLLDDATQQAIQSQAKFLFNTTRGSTSTPPHPLETMPSLEARAPETECPEEHKKACHHCPTQINTSPKTREDRFGKKITEFELGKVPPKKQNSMRKLDKEIDVLRLFQRWSDGRPATGEDSSRKAKREMSRESLGYKGLRSCSRLSRRRSSMASASHAATRLAESRKRGRGVESRRPTDNVTPKRGHLCGTTDSTRGQACGKSRGTADKRDQPTEETKKLKEKKLLESNPVGKVGLLDGKRKKQGRQSHRGDQATPTRRRPIQQKQRIKNRSSISNRRKHHGETRNPTQLRRNPRLSSRDVPPEWILSSSTNSSSSRRTTTGSTSSSSIGSHDSSRPTPCRAVVVGRPSRRTTSPVQTTRRRSFRSRRVPSRSTSLRRPPPLRPKHKQLMHNTPLEEDGKHCKTKLKKEGRLRRMKNKLSVIFHHHHHHYHHDQEHKSTWKYLGEKLHHERKNKELETIGERAAVRAPHLDQHGHFHTLLVRLLRHLWHSKSKKKVPVQRKTSHDEWLRRKKMHWWQRWRKGGGLRLCGGKKKKARLRIGLGRKETRTRTRTRTTKKKKNS